MTERFLLDANVLIALVVEEHEHHDRAVAWVATSDALLATCPITEGALVRFLVRLGESTRTASALLRALYLSGRVEFWPDTVSYCDVPVDHVVGHRQVTDAYLAALAEAHGGRLLTLDVGLANALTGRVRLLP